MKRIGCFHSDVDFGVTTHLLDHSLQVVQVAPCDVQELLRRRAQQHLVLEAHGHKVIQLIHRGLVQSHDRRVRQLVEDRAGRLGGFVVGRKLTRDCNSVFLYESCMSSSHWGHWGSFEA